MHASAASASCYFFVRQGVQPPEGYARQNNDNNEQQTEQKLTEFPFIRVKFSRHSTNDQEQFLGHG